MIRALALSLLLAASPAALAQTSVPPPAAEPAVTLTLRPDLQRPGQPFEGWGTALAWFAHVTGGYPDPVREKLADLFYGPDGLGWTIARYNIGGGDAPETKPYLRLGADVPGFWRRPTGATGIDWWDPADPAMWDWSADANQRWWLDAIKRRVKAPIFEAFSNSPPWFMTVSGKVSGAEKGTDDNLRPGQEARFAEYLAIVVDKLQQAHGISFRTLSPVNEPNTGYWFAKNTQEGAHWSPARQAMMIDASDRALKAHGLKTVIAAPDETNSHLFVRDWQDYPAATRARIGQLNVHSYGSVHQTAVRDIARAHGIRLWMSENDTPLDKDPENFDGIATPLAFAEHVVHDLKRLEPVAWVFWQAVERRGEGKGDGTGGGSNWGLIKMAYTPASAAEHPIQLTRKYWAMAQFSRYIRPGYRLVPVDDADTVGALSPDGKRLVLVHVNGGAVTRRLTIGVPGARVVERIVTDATRDAAVVPAQALAEPGAITTLIVALR